MMIAISGGGTGGHLAIAQALMQECKNHQIPCIYIGSTMGQDRLWFESESGFEKTYFLQTKGVVNQKGWGILTSVYAQLKAFFQARRILKKHKVKCVFSVGGYSSAPASFAALSLFCPLFIHEQNSIKGTLNKILSPFARKIFGSFHKSAQNFHHTSYPVRDAFFAQARKRETLQTILFLGGSQGAKAINDFALQIAPLLTQKGIKILHQSGEADFLRVKEAYEKLQIEVELFAFCTHLAPIFSQADLCFTRAGASSVWELCANALPCVYIPYPYAAGNHQFFNAQFFTQQHLGLLCKQETLDLDILHQVFLLNLASISSALSLQIQQGGAEEILQTILQELKQQ